MVEMHYFPLTYTTPSSTLFRHLHTCLVYMFSVFTLDLWANVSIAQALGQSDHGMISWPALARSTHTSIQDTKYRKNTIKLDLYSFDVFCCMSEAITPSGKERYIL